jgi:hypothetical protein
MGHLDHSLIYRARKFINAATVHRVKTWIFCYETAQPDSPQQRRYERLLREFVAWNASLAPVSVVPDGRMRNSRH